MTLKGDVDNLGAIFRQGLDAPSLSRMAALSRQMNAFFAVHLPFLCHGESRFRNTYTVFAVATTFSHRAPGRGRWTSRCSCETTFHRYVAGNARLSFRLVSR